MHLQLSWCQISLPSLSQQVYFHHVGAKPFLESMMNSHTSQLKVLNPIFIIIIISSSISSSIISIISIIID